MKKRLILTLFALLMGWSAQAYDCEVDGICYNKISATEMEVTAATEKYSGSVIIPAEITWNGTTYRVTSIGYKAFSGCSGLTSVTIPNSVTSIGRRAFYGCSGLTSVTISGSVTSLGDYAFYGCRGLTSVTIPNGVTSIGKSAFVYCSGLTSVTIPNSVDSIGYMAFWCCSGLTSVTSWAKKPPLCLYAPFSRRDTLYVPFGCKAAYKAANEWKDFSVIKELCTVALSVNDETMGGVTGGGIYVLKEQVTLEAIPAQGYQFVKWSDYNPYNPRTLTVTDNMTFTAEFAPNIYTVTLSVNDEAMGRVSGGKDYAYGTPATLEAVANEGYHFVQWHDGNTDNPRTLTVTGDISFTAEFAPNIYTVSVLVNDEAMGRVTGGGDYVLDRQATLEAVANTGYHFVRWHDGNTDNPRTLTVTGNMTFTAEFAPIYRVSVQVNDETMGSVTGGGDYVLDRQATLKAIPNQGYHFVKWHDGNTENPRTLTVTEDIELTAIFAKDETDPDDPSDPDDPTDPSDPTDPDDPSDPDDPTDPDDPSDPTANEQAVSAAPFAYVQGRTAYLSDNLGEVEAFTTTGQRVYRGFDRAIALPHPGVYILRVVADGRWCKVAVR